MKTLNGFLMIQKQMALKEYTIRVWSIIQLYNSCGVQ